MELKRVGFTAKEEQWLEAATLALSTTAGAFHVPPAMVGVSGYTSFASVKEFRKLLAGSNPGDKVKITARRGTNVLNVTVTLVKRT